MNSTNNLESKKGQLKNYVLQVVKEIPEKKVMYFGQIADLIGSNARAVGFVLTGMKEDEMNQVPWYRVVAKDGYISSLKLGEKGLIQKAILEREGYSINKDKIDMNEHLWLFAGFNLAQAEEEDNYCDMLVEGLKR